MNNPNETEIKEFVSAPLIHSRLNMRKNVERVPHDITSAETLKKIEAALEWIEKATTKEDPEKGFSRNWKVTYWNGEGELFPSYINLSDPIDFKEAMDFAKGALNAREGFVRIEELYAKNEKESGR